MLHAEIDDSAGLGVIHLPTRLTSLDAAVELVTALRASLAHVPALDFGETTLSEEDNQSVSERLVEDAESRIVAGVRGGAVMIYRSGDRLGPHQVRAETFGARWRGLDPDEVYAYLRQVADEMDRLVREATTAKTESERIRQGLRQWQARHVGCKFADPAPAPCPGARRRPGTGPDQDRAPRNGGRW